MERRRRKLENADERLAKITGQPLPPGDLGALNNNIQVLHFNQFIN